MKKIFLLSILILLLNSFSPAQIIFAPIIQHKLSFDFNLGQHRLSAVDEMLVVPSKGNFNFLINKDFDLGKIIVEGKKAKFKRRVDFDWNAFGGAFEGEDSAFFRQAVMIEVKIPKKFAQYDTLSITLNYQGIICDSLNAASFSRGNISDQPEGIISQDGIYLSPLKVYYPYAGEGMSYFTITTKTPPEYLTVTDGSLISSEITDNYRQCIWENDQPAEGIYLSGAKWKLQEAQYQEIKIYGFFFPEDSALSAQYIEAVKGYLGLYEGLFGLYPYSKFAVVENFFPTGYGMPSWTLLGQTVVRLPWIVNISLGHEVCHCWWGNGVIVDYRSGNWCEGLTTYCADYLYAERRSLSEARSYRRDINQDYAAYVTKNNDFPLKDFRARSETHTRAIGYGKSAMIFHMLRSYSGEEVFWNALRDFYETNKFHNAGWDDIQKSFEKLSGEDLNWFFRQWVDRAGAPKIKLNPPSLGKSGDVETINLNLKIKEGGYKLLLPIVVYYPDQQKTIWVGTESGERNISIKCHQHPLSVAVDPDFQLFRRLDRGEYSASLSEVLGAQNQIIVLPSQVDESKGSAYKKIAQSLNRSGRAKIISDSEVKSADIASNSYLILGTPRENTICKEFARAGLNWDQWISFSGTEGNFNLRGESYSGKDISSLVVLRNPLNPEQSLALFSASSPAEIERTGEKLIHYGKYGYLAFEAGKNKLKGNWEVLNSPLKFQF